MPGKISGAVRATDECLTEYEPLAAERGARIDAARAIRYVANARRLA
jgi:hypothetical protein